MGRRSKTKSSFSDSSLSRPEAGHSTSSSSSGRSPNRSPMIESLQQHYCSALLAITVKTTMEGGPGAKILVPPLCRVAELKSIVFDATDVPTDKQVLIYNDAVLKNDSATIANYGITKDCTIILNIKMSTGSKVARSHANMSMLFMPLVMQQGSLPSLRHTIKQMSSVRGCHHCSCCSCDDGRPLYRGKIDTSREYSTNWTPAKQMENELTRNRMKHLLWKRKRSRTLSEASSSDTSSTPYSESSAASLSCSSSDSKILKSSQSYEPTLTEKQLKTFFDPPESVEELELTRNNLVLPPSSVNELLELKAAQRKSADSICQFCHKKLALTEQHIQCLCEEKFCKKHRSPAAHYCGIDYKHTGRSKINKDNPKIFEGGLHKAREE
ncbi:hypothetical protein V3C99_009195 [Haemonchus contortus]